MEATWALRASPIFATGVKYQFHQGFWPDQRSGNPNHPSPIFVIKGEQLCRIWSNYRYAGKNQLILPEDQIYSLLLWQQNQWFILYWISSYCLLNQRKQCSPFIAGTERACQVQMWLQFPDIRLKSSCYISKKKKSSKKLNRPWIEPWFAGR